MHCGLSLSVSLTVPFLYHSLATRVRLHTRFACTQYITYTQWRAELSPRCHTRAISFISVRFLWKHLLHKFMCVMQKSFARWDTNALCSHIRIHKRAFSFFLFFCLIHWNNNGTHNEIYRIRRVSTNDCVLSLTFFFLLVISYSSIFYYFLFFFCYPKLVVVGRLRHTGENIFNSCRHTPYTLACTSHVQVLDRIKICVSVVPI